MLLVVVLLSLGLQADSPTDSDQDSCSWSIPWQELKASVPTFDHKTDDVTPPKKLKGSIAKPPDANHRVDGVWVVSAVMDSTGRIRDARIESSPRLEPAWPEYEAAIIASVLKWQYKPARLKGKPLPLCVQVTVRYER